MKNPFRKKPAPALPAAFTPAVSKPRPLLIVKREALDKEDRDLHASRAKRVADAENYRRLADLADADVRDIDAALSANAECRAKIDAYEADKMKALDALLDTEMGEQINALNVIAEPVEAEPEKFKEAAE